MKLAHSIALGLLLVAPVAAQSGTLDQQSPFSNVSYGNSIANWSRAQDIEVGISGQLEGMEFSVLSNVPGNSSTVHVYLGTFTGAAAPVFTGSIQTSSPNWETVFVDMSAANIQLNQGDFISVECVADGMQFMDLQGNSGWPSPLYPQLMYENNGGGWNTPTSNSRLGFNTYMLTQPTGPTLALFGVCGSAPSSIDITGATPNGQVALVHSTQIGSFAIPQAGQACQGTLLDLVTPTLSATGTADANGVFGFQRNFRVPAAACGAVIVQGLDVATCATTPTLAL